MTHLDDRAMAAMEAGDAAVRAHFAEHLSAACETCEDFLLQQDGPALLDGVTDEALLAQTLAQEAALDELAWRRMRKKLSGAPRFSGKVQRAFVGFASAAAVALAVLGGNQLFDERGSQIDDGIKGVSAALTLELEAAHQRPGEALQRVETGAVVPESGELVLRYYATDRATALLVKETRGRFEALGSFELEPGAHPLRLGGGELAALSLDGEAGELALWLVGSPATHPPSLDEARRAIEDAGVRRFAVARVAVHVQPTR